MEPLTEGKTKSNIKHIGKIQIPLKAPPSPKPLGEIDRQNTQYTNIASSALQGLLANPNYKPGSIDFVTEAFKYADQFMEKINV